MALRGQGLRVASYRQRATFRQRRSGYLSLVLLIGLVGGLALGSVAAARRTQSSFATYLASTNPSDLGVSVFGGPSSGGGSVPVYSRSATAAIARLPGVKHVEAAVPIAAAPLDAHGAPELEAINDIQPVASVDGLFFDQDRLAVVAGRPADPRKADQVVMTALAAHLLGVHVGEVIHYGFYDSQQESEPGFGTAAVPPLFRVDCHAGRPGAGQQRRGRGRHRPVPHLRVLHAGVWAARSWPTRDWGRRAPSPTASNSTRATGVSSPWNGSSPRWHRPATPSPSTTRATSRSRWTGRSSPWSSPSVCSAVWPSWPLCSSPSSSSPASWVRRPVTSRSCGPSGPTRQP